jgi:arsenate reductase
MKKGVLFVCLGNACRSIMAEALAKHYWGEEQEIASAGLSPLGYIPRETKTVLEEIGVSTRGLHSKGFGEIELERFHLLLDLAGYELESYLPDSFAGKIAHWRVRDPYLESLISFRQTRDSIEWLIVEKLPKWLEEV